MSASREMAGCSMPLCATRSDSAGRPGAAWKSWLSSRYRLGREARSSYALPDSAIVISAEPSKTPTNSGNHGVRWHAGLPTRLRDSLSRHFCGQQQDCVSGVPHYRWSVLRPPTIAHIEMRISREVPFRPNDDRGAEILVVTHYLEEVALQSSVISATHFSRATTDSYRNSITGLISSKAFIRSMAAFTASRV